MESNSTIYISLLAVVISVFSLGWNFYRDVLLKPRLKVSIRISYIVQQHREKKGPFIDISAINHGPGFITCNSVHIAKKSRLRFLGNKILKLIKKETKYAFVVHDYTNILSAQLPKKLDVGESMSLLFKEEDNSFLSMDPTHVGISDSFGREHWADFKSLKKTKKEYFKKHQKKEWGKV